MDKMKVHTYNVELEILTPVIINSGESYGFCELIPTREIIKSDGYDRGYNPPSVTKFYVNDTSKMFEEMSPVEVKKFIDSSVCALSGERPDNKELKKLRKEIRENTDLSSMPSAMVIGEAEGELYDKPMQSVSKAVQSPIDNRTYIPGSSIKGAIRTGLLEYLRDMCHKDYWNGLKDYNLNWMKHKVPSQDSNTILDFEMEIMKGKKKFEIESDPFKYLKISDFHFSDEDGVPYIAKIGEQGRRDSRKGAPIFSAMTNCFAFSGRNIIARGTISVDEIFFSKINSNGEINSLQDILDKMGVFYQRNIQSTLSKSSGPKMSYLSNKILKASANEKVIRIGHYIGIKDHTLNVKQVNPPKKHHKVDINITGGRLITIEDYILPGICTIKIKEQS